MPIRETVKAADIVLTAIDFIEANLKEPIRIQDIASHVRLSQSYFQRMFTTLLGEPAGTYLRKRRLQESIQDLDTGKLRIIDIAFEYQFESQESYTRAFKSFFGVPPGRYRKTRSQSPIEIIETNCQRLLTCMKRLESATPRIVDYPDRHIAGIETKFIEAGSPDANNMEKVPPLWKSFNQMRKDIPDKVSEDGFGLLFSLAEEDKSHPDEMLYACGLEVSRTEDVPPEFTQYHLPAGPYAVFTHRGPIDYIGESMDYIFGKWLPESDRGDCSGISYEFFDGRFGGNKEDSEFDIVVQLKR